MFFFYLFIKIKLSTYITDYVVVYNKKIIFTDTYDNTLKLN